MAWRRYGRARPVVVDRAGGGRCQFGEATDGSVVEPAGGPVDVGGRERLRFVTAQDRRTDRTEGQPHRPARTIHHEARTRDRDHHRVADADLGIALPAVEHRDVDLGHELARLERRLLHPDHELGHRQRSTSGDRLDHDRCLERSEHRQPVAGRRARAEVAADRARLADLRRADRAARLGQCRHEGSERRLHQHPARCTRPRSRGCCRPRSRRHDRSSGTRSTTTTSSTRR